MDPHVSIWTDLMAAPVRQHYVDAAGIRTRVLEAGDGPPLVLVHGTGGHIEAYSRNIVPLAAGGLRVIAYDMLGHGLTDKPDYPYTIDRLSDHLLAVLDALGVERAHVSGESLGGWVAAWFAAHHPERVDHLILNTPGNIANKPEVMTKVKESSLKAVREATEPNVRARLEWLFHDTSHVTDELVHIRRTIYTQPGFERAMEHIVAVQDWEVRERYAWSPEWCGEITAPTLLLWTDHDPTGGLDEADLLKGWIPGSRLHVISDAGHWPQWEQPDDFHAVHLDFLLEGALHGS
ncbi:MAG: 2-hydroxy-6-oxo-6-phenylhexa-2,4-dienoate hydrolase [Conexibacter sp.]|nr:2-hydroxy-6-oxo-6-phenylhexa-2,4-dienoate hydrolase [Conexibacter sp.]